MGVGKSKWATLINYMFSGNCLLEFLSVLSASGSGCQCAIFLLSTRTCEAEATPALRERMRFGDTRKERGGTDKRILFWGFLDALGF